jgi:hypothetical protein
MGSRVNGKRESGCEVVGLCGRVTTPPSDFSISSDVRETHPCPPIGDRGGDEGAHLSRATPAAA